MSHQRRFVGALFAIACCCILMQNVKATMGARRALRLRRSCGKIVTLPNLNHRHGAFMSGRGGAGVMMIKSSSSAAFITAPSILMGNAHRAAVEASAVSTRRGLIVSQNDKNIALRRSLDDAIASTVYYDDSYNQNVDDIAAAELNKHNGQHFTTASAEMQQQPSTQINNNNDYLVYLLQSVTSPLTTYIGITTNPIRRLRQHNGSLSTGGARRTKASRPWKYVALLHGLHTKTTAMKLEWHWQHVHKSIVFRNSINMSDKLARKMKRTRGVQSRLVELDILLNQCEPFNTMPVTLYFMEEVYRDIYCHLATVVGGEGDDDKNRRDECILRVKLSSIDNFPFGDMNKGEAESHHHPHTATSSSSSLGVVAVRRTILNIKSIACLGRRVPARRHSTFWALNAVAETSSEGHCTNSDIMMKKEAVVVGNTVTIPTKFKPYPFSYHTELIVRIESLTNLGCGIARVELDNDDNEQRKKDDNSDDNENNEGHEADTTKKKKWVIFVPNVIPDELVKVRIYRNFASYSDADLLQIIEPSLDRIQPICSLATVCGGCQYQHISITKQRQMKTLQVQELFEKLGGLSSKDFPTILDTIGTDEIYGYRSKITPHYNAPLKKKSQRNECTIGPIGFKEKASHRIVDVPYCYIATSTINDALQEIRDSTREQARLGLLKKPTKGATLLLRDSNNGGAIETNHTAYVNTKVNNLTFRFQAGNFFQNNPYMLPIMVEYVVNAATQVSRSIGQRMTHLIDCYCGSGLFCIASSLKFDVCVGIEVNEKAIEEARENALLNGILNCDFVAASAEAIFMSKEPVRIAGDDGSGGGELLVDHFPRETTVVVLDPPRKGCSEEFMAQLNDFQPARVVYMSCDPSTQARDAKMLLSYGYEIVSIQPFDLFPQTRHIENLAVFEKKL